MASSSSYRRCLVSPHQPSLQDLHIPHLRHLQKGTTQSSILILRYHTIRLHPFSIRSLYIYVLIQLCLPTKKLSISSTIAACIASCAAVTVDGPAKDKTTVTEGAAGSRKSVIGFLQREIWKSASFNGKSGNRLLLPCLFSLHFLCSYSVLLSPSFCVTVALLPQAHWLINSKVGWWIRTLPTHICPLFRDQTSKSNIGEGFYYFKSQCWHIYSSIWLCWWLIFTKWKRVKPCTAVSFHYIGQRVYCW